MASELSELTRQLQHSRLGRVSVREAVCVLLANRDSTSVRDAGKTYYSHDKDLMKHLETRAASTITSMSNTPTLVDTVGVADFNSLSGSAAVSSLWPLGTQLSFDGHGAISVPGYAASPNNMAVVGEGAAISVEQRLVA